MNVRIISVPHQLNSGYAAADTGPERLLTAGAAQRLRASGHSVSVIQVACEETYPDTLSAVTEINAKLADCVRTASKDGAFPLVLSGNCVTCLGGMAALHPTQGGVVWFDAHGDFNTPETSPSGMIDGMPLAIAAGKCHPQVWRGVHEDPIPLENILLAGVRELDPAEEKALNALGIHIVRASEVTAQGLAGALSPGLEQVARGATELYIHLDIDGLDPAVAPAVGYRTANGFSEEDLNDMLQRLSDRFVIRSLAIAAFDPAADENDATLQLGLRLIQRVAELA